MRRSLLPDPFSFCPVVLDPLCLPLYSSNSPSRVFGSFVCFFLHDELIGFFVYGGNNLITQVDSMQEGIFGS